MPTTATNSATYLVNSRLRIFVPDGLASGSAPATGDAASVRPWGVSGWREMLIQPNLARTQGLVSCRSAGGSFDDPGSFYDLVGGREQRRRHLDPERSTVSSRDAAFGRPQQGGVTAGYHGATRKDRW